jgi:nucleotide-binding universal stress UspA family protein
MRIVVAVDLSPVSESLVRFAAEMASKMSGDLVVVHAYGPDDAATAQEEAGLFLDRYIEHLRGEVNYLLTKAGAARSRARIDITEGNPIDVVLTAALRDHADLIVMGTHGRTGLSRLLVGSVAEGVLRRAPCPVAVVPYQILLGEAREAVTRGTA